MEFKSFGEWQTAALERGFVVEKLTAGMGADSSMFYSDEWYAFDTRGAGGRAGHFVVDVGQSWFQSFGMLFDSRQEYAAWMTEMESQVF